MSINQLRQQFTDFGPGSSVSFEPPQQHKAEPGSKFDAGKPRHDLFYEPFLAEVHTVLVFGEQKYGAWNFSRGMSYSRLFNAAMRHLKAWWWDREDLDPETGLHHLAHCAANLMMAYCLARLGRGNDDRPSAESITGQGSLL